MSTYATLRKERGMNLTDQMSLDRKSGVAEGSAVCLGLNGDHYDYRAS